MIDYQLPGSRLEDLLQQIRSRPYPIRSIVTSGYTLDMLNGFIGPLPAGVEFLKKPFMTRDLVAAVTRAFPMTAGGGS